MIGFRKHRHARLFASLLMVFFFGSQAFSCCLFKHRLGEFHRSALAKAGSHSCCPSPAGSRPADRANPVSKPEACCILDANLKAPQAVSEPAAIPDFPALVIGILPMPALAMPRRPSLPAPLAFSSPPLYLKTLQLLI